MEKLENDLNQNYLKYGNDELLILNWFVKFYGTKKMVKIEIDHKQYAWVNYSKVLEELPILDINKTNLYNIFINLVDFKILIHNTSKSSEGIYSVYGFGENFDRLIYNEEVKEKLLKDKNEGLLKSIEGSIEINRTKDHITNNPITNKDINNINIINNENFENIKNDNLIKTKNKPNRHIEIYNFLKEYLKDEDEDIKNAINNYVTMRKSLYNGGKLTVDKLKGILDQFEKDYKNAPKEAMLEQLQRATNLQWSAISYQPYNKFKGNTKSNYSSSPSFDNTKGHVKIYHISDEEFIKLTHEEKLKELAKFDAVADMTKLQQEFFNQYGLVTDEKF